MEIENRESRIENAPAAGRRALFLDRDGTIIFDRDYLADPAGVELIPGAAGALRRARALGYLLFLFTNQSGIGRGLHTIEDTHRCNARMNELLDLGPAPFAGICIAPEAPDQPSLYRKPSPRFILEMIAQHALDPAQCWMIGDRESDLDAGLAAGIRSAAVCTGKYDAAAWAPRLRPGVPLFADLAAFVATLA
ncbi:D-glycero-alpha-D-manno-heptose-1,7-bisphosphate 7-phosphatase [Oleiharenicola sp. Vm1]|uniref:D-glycero-alpha-D-manno-heptose-1,7-bisphosphate 7-phosphatase n=1 Tax=Oleiharenicola sp. Vm1 TaxID=3398393 RepID=UPI0039F4C215